MIAEQQACIVIATIFFVVFLSQMIWAIRVLISGRKINWGLHTITDILWLALIICPALYAAGIL